jgi:hypothetical protein
MQAIIYKRLKNIKPLNSVVVSICTTQWCLYVMHSGVYMYRTVVSMCTAQWCLCVPHNGVYMYCTVVSICTAEWCLCVPQSGVYVYRTVVSICTARLNIHKFYVLLTLCSYDVCCVNSGYFPVRRDRSVRRIPVSLLLTAPMLRIYPHLHVALTWTDRRSLELSEKRRSVRNREAKYFHLVLGRF